MDKHEIDYERRKKFLYYTITVCVTYFRDIDIFILVLLKTRLRPSCGGRFVYVYRGRKSEWNQLNVPDVRCKIGLPRVIGCHIHDVSVITYLGDERSERGNDMVHVTIHSFSVVSEGEFVEQILFSHYKRLYNSRRHVSMKNSLKRNCVNFF